MRTQTERLALVVTAFIAVITVIMIVLCNYDKNHEIFPVRIVEYVDAEELSIEEKSAMQCERAYQPKHFSVNGEELPAEVQDYIWFTLEEKGIASMDNYILFLCEIYQESHYDPYAYNASGNSYGYCQLKSKYFGEFCEIAEIPYTDLANDPYMNLYCGISFFAKNLKNAGGDRGKALRMYYNSGDYTMDAKYQADVEQWLPTVEQK